MQRNRFAPVLLHLNNLFGSHIQLFTELLGGGLTPQVLKHLALHTGELINNLNHVHRNTNSTRLVRHCAGNRLANPPGGVGGEFKALRVVEFLDRADQTQVAFLNKVKE